MNRKELDEILKKHRHWLLKDCANWGTMRANLSDMDLSGMNLRGVDLREATLCWANLQGADLSHANLSFADLHDATLCEVNLYKADLRETNLHRADLYNTNLHAANLCEADLRETNLQTASLIEADLHGADLRLAKLQEADFSGANLFEAAFSETEQNRTGMIVTSPIEGWKKCTHNVLVRLEIPRGAIVFSINNSKCRTNMAIVKEIIGADRAYSMYKHFSYYKGDKITIYNFNCQYNGECAEGIHFFKTREEAEDY